MLHLPNFSLLFVLLQKCIFSSFLLQEAEYRAAQCLYASEEWPLITMTSKINTPTIYVNVWRDMIREHYYCRYYIIIIMLLCCYVVIFKVLHLKRFIFSITRWMVFWWIKTEAGLLPLLLCYLFHSLVDVWVNFVLMFYMIMLNISNIQSTVWLFYKESFVFNKNKLLIFFIPQSLSTTCKALVTFCY